jgi:DNA-binding transcriptional MocR family regulator
LIYRDIAERLAREIASSMKPGQRLPGVRELAQRENISLITARNVYVELQQQGLIVSRQGSGTFVAGRDTGGPLDLAGIHPPEEQLLWVKHHLNLSLEGLSAYDPPEGYLPLRQEAGRWLKNLEINDEAVITAGSQQALFLAGLSLLKPGDAVAVEEPGYLGVVRIFETLGAQVRRFSYPQGPDDLEALDDPAIRLIYCMPQAHVPTGSSLDLPTRTALLELARRRGSYIIEDDPLSEICGGRPLKALDTHGRVIYLKSLSYLIGPGMRLGLAVFPPELARRLLKLKEINDLALSGLLQRALHRMLASGDFGAHLVKLRRELERRQQLAQAMGFEVSGACLWLKTPASGRLHQASLLKQGLRVTPGDIYGPAWTNYIRAALLTPPAAELERALELIRSDLTSHPGLGLTEF